MLWKELKSVHDFNHNKNISVCRLYVSALSPKYFAMLDAFLIQKLCTLLVTLSDNSVADFLAA
jgi:hypothetical protein